MRSRTTKGLLTLAALVVAAGLAGTAARGSQDVLRGEAPVAPSRVAVPTQTVAAGTGAGPSARHTATPSTTSTAPAVTAASTTWAVTKVVDGDTIWVARGGEVHKVRFIGIDTPEVGQCGYSEATRNLRGTIGGQRVTLTAGARDDVDRYGRILRYVDVNGVDAGLRQISQGFAVARYDSRDGYGRHDRESAYVRADLASPRAACAAPGPSGSGTQHSSGIAGSAGDSGGTPSAGTGSGLSTTPSTGSWPLAGDRHPCPQGRPVKGNAGSMIAHEPGDRSYTVTRPEQCFATMTEAEAAGFRPAKA